MIRPPTDTFILFNGRKIAAIEREPVIVSLLAEGERMFRTTPQTGEARGGYCMVGRCTDCLMIIDGQPGVRACMTPVTAGMTVEAQFGNGHWTVPSTQLK